VIWLPSRYAEARALNRHYGTTYYCAIQALPRADRRHVYALYGFCRYADEIVDDTGGATTVQRADALASLEADFQNAWPGGEPKTPVVAALVESMRDLGLGDELVTRFLRSMAMDLSVTSYETWAELCGYMDGSAAVVGEMVLPILCPEPVEGTLAAARQLGVAFQMTNFLRDVTEDLDRGRVYIPAEDLRRFGADPRAREVTPEWSELMRFEIARTRDLYRQATHGIRHLPRRAAACVRAAAALYEGILNQIEANRYDVFTRRARVALPIKIGVTAYFLLDAAFPPARAHRVGTAPVRRSGLGTTHPTEEPTWSTTNT
jgi:15-cis-phytoene synthase